MGNILTRVRRYASHTATMVFKGSRRPQVVDSDAPDFVEIPTEDDAVWDPATDSPGKAAEPTVEPTQEMPADPDLVPQGDIMLKGKRKAVLIGIRYEGDQTLEVTHADVDRVEKVLLSEYSSCQWAATCVEHPEGSTRI